MLATLQRNVRFGVGLLRLMPWSAWPRLALYFTLAGLYRISGRRPITSVVLPFRGVAVSAGVGRPNGLKFLLEILGHDVYGPLDTDHSAVLYDIGANCGYFAIHRCLRNPALRAWCFEPHPETFETLERNVALNGLEDQITAHQVALGDVDETLELGLPVGSSMGVVRRPGAIDLSGGSISVTGITLDRFTLDHPAPDTLKIDVEGHEVHVLKGAARLLRTVSAVVTEVHTAELAEQSRAALEAAGLRVEAHGHLLFARRP